MLGSLRSSNGNRQGGLSRKSAANAGASWRERGGWRAYAKSRQRHKRDGRITERRDLRLLSHRRAGHEAWQNQRNEFGRHSRLFRSSPETPGCNALLGYFAITAPIVSAPA